MSKIKEMNGALGLALQILFAFFASAVFFFAISIVIAVILFGVLKIEPSPFQDDLFLIGISILSLYLGIKFVQSGYVTQSQDHASIICRSLLIFGIVVVLFELSIVFLSERIYQKINFSIFGQQESVKPFSERDNFSVPWQENTRIEK